MFIRSVADLEHNSQKMEMAEKARKFFDSLTSDAQSCNASVALFAFTCDQFGFYEMKNLITTTGGFVVTHEEFKEAVFENSFNQFFKVDETGFVNKGFGTKMEMSLSGGIKVQGALGPCKSLNVSSPCVSKEKIGEGGTNFWSMGTIDPSSTMCFLFETAASEGVWDRKTAYI